MLRSTNLASLPILALAMGATLSTYGCANSVGDAHDNSSETLDVEVSSTDDASDSWTRANTLRDYKILKLFGSYAPSIPFATEDDTYDYLRINGTSADLVGYDRSTRSTIYFPLQFQMLPNGIKLSGIPTQDETITSIEITLAPSVLNQDGITFANGPAWARPATQRGIPGTVLAVGANGISQTKDFQLSVYRMETELGGRGGVVANAGGPARYNLLRTSPALSDRFALAMFEKFGPLPSGQNRFAVSISDADSRFVCEEFDGKRVISGNAFSEPPTLEQTIYQYSFFCNLSLSRVVTSAEQPWNEVSRATTEESANLNASSSTKVAQALLQAGAPLRGATRSASIETNIDGVRSTATYSCRRNGNADRCTITIRNISYE